MNQHPIILLTVDGKGGVSVQQTGEAIILVIHENTKPSCAMLLPQSNEGRDIKSKVALCTLLHDHSDRSINLAIHLRSDGALSKAPPEAIVALRSVTPTVSVPDREPRKIFASGDRLLIPANGPGPIAILAADHADEIVTAFNNFPSLITAVTATAGALETVARSMNSGETSRLDVLKNVELEARNLRLALEMAGPL